MQKQNAKQVTAPWTREMVMVVKRETLFGVRAWQGIRQVDAGAWLATIRNHAEYHPRGLMETDLTYKQIIPYLIYRHQNRYFLMTRHAKASEKRLASKLSLGIGGHIRQADVGEGGIFSWARREFHEEVTYNGTLEIEVLGILNDDSNEVGKVHLGMVLLLAGDSCDISVKSELAGGYLATLQECLDQQDRLEPWSQIVLDELQRRTD